MKRKYNGTRNVYFDDFKAIFDQEPTISQGVQGLWNSRFSASENHAMPLSFSRKIQVSAWINRNLKVYKRETTVPTIKSLQIIISVCCNVSCNYTTKRSVSNRTEVLMWHLP